jgi:hypothetical protein
MLGVKATLPAHAASIDSKPGKTSTCDSEIINGAVRIASKTGVPLLIIESDVSQIFECLVM